MNSSVLTPFSIVLISVVTVILIVTDWRLDVEKSIEEDYNIKRTWYVPIISLLILYITSVVSVDTIVSVSIDKIDIIGLVLSFALLAEGMRESGVFDYLGSIILDKSDSKYQLVIYTFIITSIATAFTSNDIVVIALTPVIFQIAVKSGLRNLKIILMTQFVAANTLSMTTYIGSPTNIILSEELGIDFVQYSVYMILPSLVAFLATLTVIHMVFYLSEKDGWFQSYEMSSSTNLSPNQEEKYISRDMLFWIILFFISVLGVALLTLSNLNLLWSAIPISTASILYLRRRNRAAESISKLPFGILFFGICFFVIGESLVSTQVVSDELVPVIQSVVNSSTNKASLFGVYITGITVNVFNDLPAAAIIAPLLNEITFQSSLQKTVIIQSTLVGLNIGKYVTQVGALAGLAWFNQIKVELDKASSNNLIVPKRADLLKFGLLNFFVTGTIVSTYLIIEYVVLVSFF